MTKCEIKAFYKAQNIARFGANVCPWCAVEFPASYGSAGTHGTKTLMCLRAWSNFKRHTVACGGKKESD